MVSNAEIESIKTTIVNERAAISALTEQTKDENLLWSLREAWRTYDDLDQLWLKGSFGRPEENVANR